MSNLMFDLCVHHRGCSDGIAGAWVIKRVCPEIQLISCNAGEDPVIPEGSGRKIVFVDVCPSKNFLRELLEKDEVVLLDHHVTALDVIKEFDGHAKFSFVYDKERAGCQIAWDFMYGKTETLPLEDRLTTPYKPDKRPYFINYIADRDLWKFSLPRSKDVNTGLFYGDGITLTALDALYKTVEENPEVLEEKEIERLANFGEIVNKLKDKDLQITTNRATKSVLTIGDSKWNVWLVDGPYHLRSEVCASLVSKPFKDGTLPDFACFYRYDLTSNEWWIATRSKADSGINLAELCKSVGGGGHPNASGFHIKGDKHLKDFFSVENIEKSAEKKDVKD